ncbi:hypothetical protein AQUCO_03800055v1 [Aquilegia coerulea]|uniref:Uncharacterized protein n=1 Tax=Aquilegia coerulea TaxID=218851 RepID=A0A2G5CSD9_AQUCA|nr:hypothetical protein AQUCO_03800055v1 [Aquilegia coerulea]
MMIKSKKEKENEGINEGQMTLAQCFQSLQSSSEPLTPLSMVVLNKPETPSRSVPSFQQVVLDKPAEAPLSYEQEQAFPNHDKVKLCAIQRAEEVQANLDPRFPSFVKSMLHSHVIKGFWMRIPGQFCKTTFQNMMLQLLWLMRIGKNLLLITSCIRLD